MKTRINELILTGLFLVFANWGQAQISQKVIKQFPAHIIYQINEMSSKIVLNEDKQIKVGKKLFARDSLANVELNKGEAVSKLKIYYEIEKNFFQNICTQEEIEEYFHKADPTNRFLLALRSITVLKLNPTQISQLREQNAVLDLVTITNQHKKIQYYNSKLESILDRKQFVLLIKQIYSQQSLEETKKDWKNIQQFKLISTKDTSGLYKELYNYNLMVNTVVDPQSEKLGVIKNREVRNALMLQKQPSILTRYNILSEGSYKKNLFSTTIKFQEDLNLAQIQIDSLLSKYRTLELQKLKDEKKDQMLNKKSEYILYENTAILEILDPKQLARLLIKKNEKAASNIAVNSWEELEQLGLTKNVDRNTTLKEFMHYQLNFLVASDEVKMNNNAVNIFNKRDVELKKPELLKQLEQTKRNQETSKSAKNALKW
ncbi:hypothetical protein [Flavobacterium collinsii]|uniref:Uncharacterized protein n=1 Tax=Flavobacterium collinsii TaxID=1114861 RepID=A0A9W4TJT4_9FLAO|nr:hypothetical protein [Flavobacterium collinsii]CAI2768201.1 conserved protein of unknown function [Flavobacterium collinsii]